MTTQKTCEQRVTGELAGRIEDLQELWRAYCEGEEEVEDLGNLCDYGLCFDYVAPGTFEDQDEGYFRYQLSWGGPSDEFRFFVGPDFQPYRVEYWFLDWFDGAYKRLTRNNLDLLLEIFDWFKESGAVQAKFDEATQ